MSYCRLLRRLLVLVLGTLVLVGCGSDGEDSATPAAQTSPPKSSRCTAVTTDLMTPLSNGLEDEAHRLRNGFAVESRDHDDIFFVSAELYGEGLDEPGPIGTWATTSLGGAEAIYALDDVSKRYSDLRDGAQVAGLSMDDDGAKQSRNCVRG